MSNLAKFLFYVIAAYALFGNLLCKFGKAEQMFIDIVQQLLRKLKFTFHFVAISKRLCYHSVVPSGEPDARRILLLEEPARIAISGCSDPVFEDQIFFQKGILTMKRVLSILLCVMMIGAVSALTLSATAAVADGVDVSATEETTPVADDPTEEIGDVTEPVEATEAQEATETEQVTEAEQATEAETVAETTAETVAATAATEAATQAATQPAKNASPKTGDNLWLFIGIGIVVVAIIVIIITVVAKKKKDKAQ